jgi:hypothetical protein
MSARRRIRIADIVIIAASLCAVGASALFAAAGSSGAARLLVKTEAGEFIYPLDKDARIEAKGPLGTTVILVAGGKARIMDSPCDNKTCIAMGAISRNGQWASCLPNRVFLNVSGGSKKVEVDAGAY